MNAGVLGYGQLSTAGTVSSVEGVRGYALVQATATGTITNAYGLRSLVTEGAGTITNGYGLHIADVEGTNQWGIYQSSSTDKNTLMGNTGIGTTAPSQKLSVNGTAGKSGGGSWATFSDRRVKEDVLSFTDGLVVIDQLSPVSFRYNEQSGYSDTDTTYIGFIAQDVESVAPYMVSDYDDSDGPSGLTDKKTFDESALTKILVNAVKELKAENEAIKAVLCSESPDTEFCD